MTVLAAPFAIVAGLVVVAGLAKLREPAPTAATLHAIGLPGGHLSVRLLGMGEVAVGAGAIAFGGRLPAALLATLYVGFVGVVAVLLRRDASAGCGCFGRADTPVTRVHVGLNCLCALTCIAAVGIGVAPLGDVIADQPAAGIPMILFIGSGVAILVALLTIVPRLGAPPAAVETFALRPRRH